MEGIRLTGQSLYSEDSISDVLDQSHSILVSKGLDVDSFKDTIAGESFLNSVEVSTKPYQDGTYINVDYGMTTVGILLTVIFLFLGGVIGIILILLWYLKYDELKGAFRHAYPSYTPPPPASERYEYSEEPKDPLE